MKLRELAAANDWLGVLAHEREVLALAREIREAHPKDAGSIYCNLGLGYFSTGDYARAREMYEQYKTMAEALGDRAGVATACGNLGNCYFCTGDDGRAREMYEQHKAMAEELGDLKGVATTRGNLGNFYFSTGDYVRSRELHEQHRAMAEALGDRAGVSRACANLGLCYHSTGDYGRARELHEQARAMAEALGDRAQVARACSNLGNCYDSTGDFARAHEMHEQHRAMAEALGDRAGVSMACANLGCCMSSTGEYMKAISYFETQHAIAVELELAKDQVNAVFNMGAAMRMHVRADRQAAAASPPLSPAAGASRVPGPRSSASAHLEDRVKKAATWLETARAAGHGDASLHLAHLAFDAGVEDLALDLLKDFLSWLVARGRDWCVGCRQRRGEDAPMLTCSGCRVARFCSTDHQKMASKSVAAGGNVWTGRHKDICGLLGKWRGVEKDGVSPDSLRADLLEFLRQRQ